MHCRLGHGFLESVYHDALAIEFQDMAIPFHRELPIVVHYKSRILPTTFRVDFVCFDSIIVELKALRALTSADHAQVINYLKATGFSRGLLINFGAPSLEYKRFVFTRSNATQIAG